MKAELFGKLRFKTQMRLTNFTLVLLLCLAAPLQLLAQEHYLAPNHPDGIALLPPPPAPGSDEAAADLQEARAVFNSRTHEQEARAMKDAKLTFALYEPAIGSGIHLDKLPKTDAVLKELKSEIKEVIDAPKAHYHRLRPYQVDPSLSLGAPESNASYPSGHSTVGMVYALVLAQIYPEKKDAILEIGRNIGWDRVVIGKHFPTDVYAGRVLATAIVREMLANPMFQHDVEAAKAEAHSAKP
jgi:acid phosphatase (class A)